MSSVGPAWCGLEKELFMGSAVCLHVLCFVAWPTSLEITSVQTDSILLCAQGDCSSGLFLFIESLICRVELRRMMSWLCGDVLP